jgi:hypothetical protein
MSHTKTYHPVQTITIDVEIDIKANRFIGFNGVYCYNDTKAQGVSEIEWKAGTKGSVISLGTAVVEAVEDINSGENVASNSEGKAKIAGQNSAINGRALNSCKAGGFLTIQIVP